MPTPALCCPPPGPGLHPRPAPVSPPAPSPDHDYELVCGVDPATGHQVFTKWDVSVLPSQAVERFDAITGAPWTGDPSTLEPCGSTMLESDVVVMCDNGTTFLRHIVKDNGEPTGVRFDTALDGSAYLVVDESLVSTGACDAPAVQALSSATAADLTGLTPGTSIAVYKPACCTVELVTSDGTIRLPRTCTAYSTQIFKTPITVTAVNIVDGTCDPADITIISNLSV